MSETTVPRRPFNAYLDPEEVRWLDSMEGVPDVAPLSASAGDGQRTARWQQELHGWLHWLGEVAPGLMLAGALAWLGSALARWIGTAWLGFERSPLSPIMVTILLGLLVRQVAGLPASYEKGLRLAVKRILRLGIVLLGLRLSLASAGQIGLTALPVVVGCIAAALLLVTGLGRLMGLPSRLGTLISVGTGICGASAIVATGPAIDAEEDEVSYAVACITLFGLTALFVYPCVAHWLFEKPELVGLFLGTAIHDTSQVAGAGLMYRDLYQAPTALTVAVTTKLVRNLCMGAVIPLMAVLHHRRRSGPTGTAASRLRWYQMVPLFVVAFVVMAGLRSWGDMGPSAFGILQRSAWEQFLSEAKSLSVMCLTVAMAAVGLGTSISQLKVLGWKPLLVGLAAAVSVGGVSFLLIRLLVVLQGGG